MNGFPMSVGRQTPGPRSVGWVVFSPQASLKNAINKTYRSRNYILISGSNELSGKHKQPATIQRMVRMVDMAERNEANACAAQDR